jgi:hypothetical protein
MKSPVGLASKMVGAPIKAFNQALTSPVLAGAQAPTFGYYFGDGPVADIWKQSKNATKDLSTIGRGLSEIVYGKQNTWLSGTTDAIASLVAAPYEFGRALGYGKSVERTLTAVDSNSVDRAFMKSSGYRRAIGQIKDMADGKYGENVQKDLAGAITRAMPSLESISVEIANAAKAEGATARSISNRIGELADQTRLTEGTVLPTTGLYGMMRMQSKLSDSYVPSYFSRVLGQAPMSVDEVKKIMTTNSIDLNDPHAGYKLGQLLQITGMKSSDVTRIVNHLVSTKDVRQWENVVKNALVENFRTRIDQRFAKALGISDESWQKAFKEGILSPEQNKMLDQHLELRGFETLYSKIHQSVVKAVEDLVGNSSSGKAGSLFAVNGEGDNISELENSLTAAVTENQRGVLHLPDYVKFEHELGEILKGMKEINSGGQKFEDFVSRLSLNSSEAIDSFVNERFFKPLALLTPGWAFRVSSSEIALNASRLGPLNLTAGAFRRTMIQQERKAVAAARVAVKEQIGHLEDRAAEIRKIIKSSGDSITAQKYQEELNNLESHINWLNSPAGTPKPQAVYDTTAMMPPRNVDEYLKRRGYTLAPAEVNNLVLLARGAMSGASEAVIQAIGKDDFLKYGSYLIYRHGGYLPGMVDSTHQSYLNHVDLEGEATEVARVKRKYKRLGEDVPVEDFEHAFKKDRKGNLKTSIRLMSPDDFRMSAFGAKGYFEGWHYGANTLAGSQMLGRPLAQKYLELVKAGYSGQELRQRAIVEASKLINALPDDVFHSMIRSIFHAKNESMISAEGSWAQALVDKLEGIAAPTDMNYSIGLARTSGKMPDTWNNVHEKLLEDIANNNLPMHVNEFYQRYAFDDAGKRWTASSFQTALSLGLRSLPAGATWLLGFQLLGTPRFLAPLSTTCLASQPSSLSLLSSARRLRSEFLMAALTADQADVIAETTAAKRMVRYIHNPDDKTKFEQVMRTVAPFYFAQNQAWRRMGRLFAENPGAFMQYMAMMMGVQNLVSDAINQNGMAVKVIPGMMLYGMPFTGSLSSLSTMDPFFMPQDAEGGGQAQSCLTSLLPSSVLS